VTAQVILAEAARLGVVLVPDEKDRLRARPTAGPLSPELRAGIRANKDRLVAILRLREWHRRLGFSEAEVEFIEQALLSTKVSEIRIVPRVSVGGPA